VTGRGDSRPRRCRGGSGSLLEATDAFLDRLDGLGRHLLRVLGKLLRLRGHGVELRAQISGGALDHLGMGLCGQQFAE